MENAQRKAVAKKASSAGVVFAMVTDGSTWEVWKLCQNYCGQVRGGMQKTWRHVEKNLTETDARKLFERRTK